MTTPDLRSAMIAEGLASVQATEVLLMLTARFDPERDEAVWAIGSFGGGGFSVEPRKGEMVAMVTDKWEL